MPESLPAAHFAAGVSRQHPTAHGLLAVWLGVGILTAVVHPAVCMPQVFKAHMYGHAGPRLRHLIGGGRAGRDVLLRPAAALVVPLEQVQRPNLRVA